MRKRKINPFLLADAYKLGHVFQFPKNILSVYTNFTPRKSRISGTDFTIFFGLQAFIKEYIIDTFNENFFSLTEEEAVDSYKEVVEAMLGVDGLPSYDHIRALHKLGYMPLRIKALPEGSKVPMKIPALTMINTQPDFYWLPNFIESLLSAQLWTPCTSATIAFLYKKLLTQYAVETSDNVDFVNWQGHDFSFRGMSSVQSACSSAAGHLTSFTGTDTVPAINYMMDYYNSKITDLIGGSVPATEHSVMCAGSKDGEFETFERLIKEVYPKGIVSIVSDTWDLWKVLTDYLPRLKEVIEKRDGKIVIRPDSGDPVDIICGINTNSKFVDLSRYYDFEDSPINHPDYFEDSLLEAVNQNTPHGKHGANEWTGYYKINGKFYEATIHNIQWNRYDKQYYYIDMYDEAKITVKEIEQTPVMKGVIETLYDVFGGTVNSKGYIELPSYIGAIYGDSITLERAKAICERLKEKGFASTNIVFGIGSFTYQYNTRDTFGWAMKATYVELEENFATIDESDNSSFFMGTKKVGMNIFKDPITDDGTKKSAKGLLRVDYDDKLEKYVLKDECTWEEEAGGALELVFEDGVLLRDTNLQEIRDRLISQL